MSKVQKRTFSLPEDQAAYIDAKVATGGYVSSSEVIREGLRAMQQRDAAIERWLRQDVLPVAEELQEFPERGIPIDDAFERIYDGIRELEVKKAQ